MSRDFLIHNGKLTSDLDADGNQIKNLPGVAHLVDGKVPSDELPSYVDDVLEYATRSSFPETGERGKIYIALDTNKQYRWGGTTYVEIAGTPTLDDTVTSSSANGVKSSGIWSALWGTASTAFTSLYDWAVAQLGLKRDYTDLSYDTTETVEVPALHSVMTVGGQALAEYDLLCAEEVPDPPQIGHTYTWRADGAAFYVTQGVSALQTTWMLYSQNGESLDGVTTQNATQGSYPDLDFRPSGAVITTHKTTVQKQITTEDELALKSGVPAPSTATPAMDGTGAAGTSAAFARGDHVHPTDTSRVPTTRTVNGKALSSDVTLTGADIPVDATQGAQKINAALAGKATKADATLTERGPNKDGFSAWICDPAAVESQGGRLVVMRLGENGWYPGDEGTALGVEKGDTQSTSLSWGAGEWWGGVPLVATRTALPGYQLGSQDDKPLASEAEAEALRNGKADRAANPTAGNLAALDASGNPTDSAIPAANVAIKGDLRYALTTKTIDNGAVTLDDRAINAVAVSSSLASLTVNFPTATNGKVRDFGLRLTVASGVTTAPQLVLPQGVVCENADGEAPEIGADGAATILYFTETASGVFLVKGEVVQTIS